MLEPVFDEFADKVRQEIPVIKNFDLTVLIKNLLKFKKF